MKAKSTRKFRSETEEAKAVAKEVNERLKAQYDLPPENGDDYCADFLRSYATSWIKSGYDLERWSDKVKLEEQINKGVRELEQYVNGRIYEKSTFPLTSSVEYFKATSKDELPPVDDEFLEFGSRPKLEGRRRASELFRQFVIGPFYNKLIECKRASCKTPFVNTSGHKLYCSRKCAKTDTARSAMQQSRANQRGPKLKWLKEGAEEFARLPTTNKQRIGSKSNGWFEWVLRTVRRRHPVVTKEFFQRAINNGEIETPSGP